MEVYRCEKCANMVEELRSGCCVPFCCGEPMTKLVPGTSDGAKEKHVPVFNKEGVICTVEVGSVEHPSTPEHYIEWIAAETTTGVRRWTLKPGDAPKVEFTLNVGEIVVAVYAYCNLHGLWKA